MQTHLAMTRGRPNPRYFGLAKRLRAARNNADLGIAQLSLGSGLSSTTATLIERGGVPHLDTVEKLAKVLNVSPCLLAYGVEAPPIEGNILACNSIGTRLRQIRQARGLSLRALARGADLTASAVSNIESKGHMPTVATVEALAKALQVDPCWLGYGQGPPPILSPDAP